MSEAPEEKIDPTIEEQRAKLEAELLELDRQQGERDATEPLVSEQTDEKVEIPPPSHPEPEEATEGDAKAYLMQLDMKELRDIANVRGLKIPFNVRSKDAISDLLIAHANAPAPEVATPEAPEAEVVAEAPISRLASSVEIIRLLDELEGHGPTVRQFQDLSVKIKALLP